MKRIKKIINKELEKDIPDLKYDIKNNVDWTEIKSKNILKQAEQKKRVKKNKKDKKLSFNYRKFIVVLSCLVVFCTAIITPFLFIKDNKLSTLESKRQVYVMSAISSVNYLSSNKLSTQSINEMITKQSLLLVKNINPISKDDAKQINNVINMFRDIINYNIKDTEPTKNTDIDEDVKEYKFKYVLSFDNGDNSKYYVIYFNEYKGSILDKDKEEIEDGNEEFETNSSLEGIVKFDNKKYEIEGEIKYEKEEDESEFSIEFKTVDSENPNDWVEISQSINDNKEFEYEYSIFSNGEEIQKTELEIETENGKTKLELELYDLLSTDPKSDDDGNVIVYEITNGQNSQQYFVKFEKNGNEHKIIVNVNNNGQSEFILDNDEKYEFQ